VITKAEDFIIVGEIVKAVGLKGEIKLYPLINWYEPLLGSRFLVWEDGEKLDLKKWRINGPCYALSIEGVLYRDEAESMVGRKVGFLRSDYLDEDFPKPEKGLPFRYLGREVQTIDGEIIGNVEEVRLHGNQFTLLLQWHERLAMIPAVEPILKFDDKLSGSLIVDLPEGLLDVAGD
jgi:ribosomal 30S subunit maturation factor RimM